MTSLPATLQVFIVSDLHAHCQDTDQKPSFLDTRSDESNPASHPVTGLKTLIREQNLRADLLLCAGDLGDKAVPEAIKRSWCWLNELKVALNASDLYATAGNHDVDSRYVYNDYDARGVLQALTPLFPVSNQIDFDRFWSRHYVVINEANYRLVVLNSSAYHGFGNDEYQRGRISKATLTALEADLVTTHHDRLNILLCHHHPHHHSELNLGEKDLMLGGQLLLEVLGSGKYGPWTVIHGHKHHPKISYGQSSTSVSPIVMASGSMCAVLYPELQANVRNQVHLIEFMLDDIRMKGIRGTFRSWDWAPSIGWVPAGDRSGLPHAGGFGHREQPAQVTEKIISCITEVSIEWNELLLIEPNIRYLTPADWQLVKSELRGRSVQVLEVDGQILRLERTE